LLLVSAGSLLHSQDNKAGGKKKERASPHETVSWTIHGKKITVVYGRPYRKGRQIAGGLVPYGEVWRTGADEATTFTTDGDLMVGPLHVVAGSYSLFTVPGEKEWTLVLNKTVNQWGAFKYDKNMDYGRAPMKVGKAPAMAEQFTIDLEKKGADSGLLKLTWENTTASIDIQVH
jgi:hypothetical protein